MTMMESNNLTCLSPLSGEMVSPKGSISSKFSTLGTSNLVQGPSNNILRRRLKSSIKVREMDDEERWPF